jgi:hypothetical protein
VVRRIIAFGEFFHPLFQIVFPVQDRLLRGLATSKDAYHRIWPKDAAIGIPVKEDLWPEFFCFGRHPFLLEVYRYRLQLFVCFSVHDVLVLAEGGW